MRFLVLMTVVALAGIACSSDEPVIADSDTPGPQLEFESFDTAPKPTKTVSPTYPESARQDEVSGTTHVEVTVDEAGNVRETRVIKSSGDSRLDEATEKAALNWKFEPASQQGTAAVAKIVIPIKFVLD